MLPQSGESKSSTVSSASSP